MSWRSDIDEAIGCHEEIEFLERLIANHLRNESIPISMNHSQRIRNMIYKIMSTTHTLLHIYDRLITIPIDHSVPPPLTTYTQFYDDLKLIRTPQGPVAIDQHQTFDDLSSPLIQFSGEEALGKFLDLHQLFNLYLNSKFADSSLDYSAYLQLFPQLPRTIPPKLKSTNQYMDYLTQLLVYLISFFQRTRPLQDLDRIFSKLTLEFQDQWAAAAAATRSSINLDKYTSVDQLVMGVGHERIKEALASLGLKIGGTLQQRARRLFLTKHTNHFPKHSKQKQIALMEAKFEKLCHLLRDTIHRTIQHVQNKQLMTYHEIQAQRAEDEYMEVDDDDEQQLLVHNNNPLKLPMGWDGKPIPYWLFKLHGLGQRFSCEICGNRTYWGRRAFQRHFKEPQHHRGMRCLGIPNTNHFNDITSIREAQQLWDKMQGWRLNNNWRPDLHEEYEDQHGNVYDAKTYADLKRQGLIH